MKGESVSHKNLWQRNHWNTEEQHKLAAAHVVIVGTGAVGSFAAEALIRAGISRFTLIDGDVIEPSNVNRQLYALHSTIGEAKVKVAKATKLAEDPEFTSKEYFTSINFAKECSNLFAYLPAVSQNSKEESTRFINSSSSNTLFAKGIKSPFLYSLSANFS